MATEGAAGRTGRDGQTAGERAGKRAAEDFAQTPEGRMIKDLTNTVNLLEAKLKALEQQLAALTEPTGDDRHLRPTGANQFWRSAQLGVAHWA